MDTLLIGLIVLGMVNHQVTHIITESQLFAPLRDRISEHFGYGSAPDYLVHCALCAGTWVGLVLALVAVNLGMTYLGNPVADVALLGFANAMIGRAFNETLGLLSQHVRRTQLDVALQTRSLMTVPSMPFGPMSQGTRPSDLFPMDAHSDHIVDDWDDETMEDSNS